MLRDENEKIYGYTKAGVAITDPALAELMAIDHFKGERSHLQRAKRGEAKAERQKETIARMRAKSRGAYARGLYMRRAVRAA